jgi:hypothetical protein
MSSLLVIDHYGIGQARQRRSVDEGTLLAPRLPLGAWSGAFAGLRLDPGRATCSGAKCAIDGMPDGTGRAPTEELAHHAAVGAGRVRLRMLAAQELRETDSRLLATAARRMGDVNGGRAGSRIP